MSTDLIFEYFATLATAPDGIPRLRELILQLAVQGKLGTQDERDEPASVLLEKIRKEKERLVKEGQIKKEKTLDVLNESEISKKIPSSWVFAYLNDLCELVADPDHNMPKAVDDGVKFISAKDLRDDGSINFETNVKCISEEDYQRLARKIQPKKGDIIFSRIGSIGKSSIVKTDEKFMISYSCCVIRPLFVDVNYLNYFLREASSLIVALQKTQGIGVPDLGMKMIKQFIVPLPPLAEQARIVSKVDRLMALCDELDARQQQERAGCLRLGTASLAGLQNAESPEEFGRQWEQVCDAFDLILDCPENVVVLRQTILQLAVQGRLVRQEPGDEPAGKLVERIKAKKKQLANERESKAEKVLEPIRDDEIPFTISKQWLWDRLGSVLIKLQDGVHNSPVNISNGDFMYVTAKNIKPEGIQLSNITYISAKDHEDSYKRCDPKFGDVLLIKDGATTGIATINNLHQPFSMLSSVALLRTPQEILNKYLLYVLRSPFFYTFLREDMSGCAITRVTLTKLNRFIIPLPPLAEQHRIVAKVDALMALCDALEARLKERAGVQGLYAVAVVKGIA